MLIARSIEIHKLPSICHGRLDLWDMYSLPGSIYAQYILFFKREN